jgi:midasin (ATPase involved in ribosome maturation)
MGDGEVGEEAAERKLIDEYQQYLQKRQSASASVETIGGSDQLMQPVTFTFDQGEAFDYGQARAMIRELFQTYHSDPDLISTSQQLLHRFKQETSTSAASLCEQLRIVLEPQLS